MVGVAKNRNGVKRDFEKFIGTLDKTNKIELWA